MKERPILFSGESVRAILEGRKTQTRRVVKLQPMPYQKTLRSFCEAESTMPRLDKCPFGKPGDRLWVREAWADTGFTFRYAADEKKTPKPGEWSNPMFMPRAASRLTLEITAVRVERLQEIERDDDDIEAEGCGDLMEFYVAWDELNARRGFPVVSNPWVWVIEFKKAES